MSSGKDCLRLFSDRDLCLMIARWRKKKKFFKQRSNKIIFIFTSTKRVHTFSEAFPSSPRLCCSRMNLTMTTMMTWVLSRRVLLAQCIVVMTLWLLDFQSAYRLILMKRNSHFGKWSCHSPRLADKNTSRSTFALDSSDALVTTPS